MQTQQMQQTQQTQQTQYYYQPPSPQESYRRQTVLATECRLWIEMLEGRLNSGDSLSVAEMQKLEENRTRLAFVERCLAKKRLAEPPA